MGANLASAKVSTRNVGNDGNDAIVYNDVFGNLNNARIPPANAPTWTSYRSGQVLAFAVNDYVTFNFQHDHGVSLGKDFEFHVHVVPSADEIGKSIKFEFTISFMGIGSDFPTETTYSKELLLDDNIADKHVYMDISDITPPAGQTVSSIGICSLKRIAVGGVEYTGDLYVIFADFHFKFDTIGSIHETSKS